tara:strand:+ start:156 stop:797 length:642 start_codon:yes stop_codon:yes gene_type:complete
MKFNYNNYIKILENIEKKKKIAKIIAISKNHPKEAVIEALKKGIRVFGENRVQEALAKFDDLKKEYPDIKLHFTGNLQTNKIKQAISLFDSFHTLYKEKQLIEFAKYPNQILNKEFFIQVNTGFEETKGGLLPQEIEEFIKISSNKYNIKLAGLMSIPPINENPKKHFMLLKKIKKKLNLKKLSMGMSNDYEQAIDCDSDYLRIGTLIFGERS